jgi:hypothetical protein
LVEFHSEELAAAFFRRLLREPANRIAMRRALGEAMGAADLFRRSDEEVARWLARKVVFGDLRILAHDMPQRSVPTASKGGGEATPRQVEQAVRAEKGASPAQSRSSSASSSEEEEDPLLADTDQAAQAATLQAAAESGAPLVDT